MHCRHPISADRRCGLSSTCRRRTEPRAYATGTKKIDKDRACGSGDILADRQTDIQTYSSQYFATAPAGELIITSLPPVSVQSIAMSVSLCLSVCLSVRLSASVSPKRHVQTSRNFLYKLTVVVVRFFSDDNVIRYVLPVSRNGPHGAWRWK